MSFMCMGSQQEVSLFGRVSHPHSDLALQEMYTCFIGPKMHVKLVEALKDFLDDTKSHQLFYILGGDISFS